MEVYEKEHNKVAEPRGRAQWLIILLVFFVSICAVVLSIGAMILAVRTGNDQESNQMQIVNTVTSDVEALKNLTESQAAALKSLQDLYQGLNNKVIEVQMENTIQVQVLNRSVSALKAVVESGRTVSAINELDLTAGCPAPVSAQCSIQRLNVGTPPASATCETDAEPLEVEGFRNVNIYCSVNNSGGETNPVTSTLNIYNGEVSCLCNLVALTAPTANIVCTLNIQRCPETVRLNTTNMQ